jgi:hypothetical protein
MVQYDEERKEQWKKATDNWRKLMEMARQKEKFQTKISMHWAFSPMIFSELSVDLTGLEGMTNYIHMIASGHTASYQ